jgi:hypothetical protein
VLGVWSPNAGNAAAAAALESFVPSVARGRWNPDD